MNNRLIPVPLKLVVQVCLQAQGTKLADRLQVVLHSAANEVRENTKSRAIRKFESFVMDKDRDDLLQFELDAFDHDLAILLFNAMKNWESEGLIYSKHALVNAGYVRAQGSKFSYQGAWVDSAQTDPNREKSPITTRLIPANRGVVEAELSSMCDYYPEISVVEGDEIKLKLGGYKYRSQFKRLKSLHPACYTLDTNSTPARRTRFSDLRIEFSESGRSLEIVPTRSEEIMQLSALQMSGHWMEIVDQQFRAVFPIPDISKSDDRKRAWVAHYVNDDSYIYCKYEPDLLIPLALAKECRSLFWWFVLSDNSHLMENKCDN